jgi:hypothetical protein
MASTYYRGNSIWVRYKSPETGKWTDKSTGYKKNNPGERRQAEKLRDTLTLRERTQQPVTSSGWDWVGTWVEGRWRGLTLRNYKIHWRHLEGYLKEIGCSGPANLTRDHCLGYPKYRAKKGVGANTSALEIKLLAQVMDESISRGYAEKNPCRNLRLARTAVKEKEPFSDEQLAALDAIFSEGKHEYPWEYGTARVERLGWLHITYLLGRYQAARIMQARVPLSCIDLGGKSIHWPASVVKGGQRSGKGYSQHIDKRLLPELREIVRLRREAGEATLCTIPALGSLHWRKFLDSLGMTNVSHHSLRVRWVSEAAKAGIPEAVAMRCSNHSSSEVHRIYLKLSTGDMASMLDRLS